MPNPVDNAINNDFLIIIEASPLLKEAFDGLPQSQKDAVLARWNDLVWQMIFEAAKGKDDAK